MPPAPEGVRPFLNRGSREIQAVFRAQTSRGERATPRKLTQPAGIARNQLGKLLKQAAQHRARFLITKSGEPIAVLLSVADFDDMIWLKS